MIHLRRGPTGRRLLLAAIIGLASGGGAAAALPWQFTELIGWDMASLVFLILTWVVIGPKSAAETEVHAAIEDPSAPLSDLVIVSAAIACIAGAGFALSRASSSIGGTKAGLIALAVLSVLFSWSAVHTVFTLRYARLYYGGGEKGGVNFNEDDPPDYRDFAYLALTIGMTFQVSDTDLGTKVIRRMALRHALISWLFGAVLIGLTINILASLLSSGGG